jgi:type VI protein secretion system component VasK
MMAPESNDKQTVRRDPDARALRWLGVGGGIALVLAALAVLLAWQRASDERRAAEDVRARVQAEMNRIEAEAQRIEREAAK